MTMLAPHEHWLSALALPGGPATLAARVRECDSGGPIMGPQPWDSLRYPPVSDACCEVVVVVWFVVVVAVSDELSPIIHDS